MLDETTFHKVSVSWTGPRLDVGQPGLLALIAQITTIGAFLSSQVCVAAI